MTSQQIRILNLRKLRDDLGSAAALCRKVKKHPSTVSQWLGSSVNPTTKRQRVLGDKVARAIEEACELPVGWLDNVHPNADNEAPTNWPFTRISKDQFDRLSEAQRLLLEAQMLVLIEGMSRDHPND